MNQATLEKFLSRVKNLIDNKNDFNFRNSDEKTIHLTTKEYFITEELKSFTINDKIVSKIGQPSTTRSKHDRFLPQQYYGDEQFYNNEIEYILKVVKDICINDKIKDLVEVSFFVNGYSALTTKIIFEYEEMIMLHLFLHIVDDTDEYDNYIVGYKYGYHIFAPNQHFESTRIYNYKTLSEVFERINKVVSE